MKYILTTFILLFCNLSIAGPLSDLEKESTEEKQQPSYRSSNDSSESDSDTSGLVEFVFDVLIFGGANTAERYTYQAPKEEGGLYREFGDPIQPMFRLQSNWFTGSEVDSHAYKFEAGMGPFGISYQKQSLQDNEDELDLSQFLFHYRMSFGNHVSWDIAFGQGKMKGQSNHQGRVISLPARIRLVDTVHFQYIPTFSDFGGASLNEYEFSLNWQKDHVGLTTGFKRTVSGDVAISGVFGGLFLNF